MILVWGNLSDTPVERIVDVLLERESAFFHIDDAALPLMTHDVVFTMPPTGWIELRGQRLPLDEIRAAFIRPGELREARGLAAASTLSAIAASLDARVINRPAAGRSNWSKPFQLRLIEAAGLNVPETLVTTDPAKARAFLARHRRVVYKSVSGVRSIVTTLDTHQAARLDDVSTGPVQLQRWIAGRDVRVHVVGDRWFATAIESDADDYRYAARSGDSTHMAATDIPQALGERLVALSHSMGLLLSGIDLRADRHGEWYCFEVNPSPGFSYFEDMTGQPIAAAIVELLAGNQSHAVLPRMGRLR